MSTASRWAASPRDWPCSGRGDADAFVDVWQVVRAIAEIEGMTVYNAGPTGYSYDLTVGYRGDQPVLGSILQKTLDHIPQSTLERLQSTTP